MVLEVEGHVGGEGRRARFATGTAQGQSTSQHLPHAAAQDLVDEPLQAIHGWRSLVRVRTRRAELVLFLVLFDSVTRAPRKTFAGLTREAQ
jgi:hypothetical protein